jgi:high-affinity nickel permease
MAARMLEFSLPLLFSLVPDSIDPDHITAIDNHGNQLLLTNRPELG